MSAPEVEALVEVAAEAITRSQRGGWVYPDQLARAVLAAVAEPLMALGGERLAEVTAAAREQHERADTADAERYEWKHTAYEERRRARDATRRAERAEADLAAAEQRGAERVLREVADELGNAYPVTSRRLRDRADRLATQAARDGEDL